MKTVFNDPRDPVFKVTLECSGCRSEIQMKINSYPHGPQSINCCPICLQGKDGIVVKFWMEEEA
jgi:hypothetical protein